ncbi:MAG: TetR/AcrR family transcriptional regulator, partial [Gammaproteobacteria bacterium]|nr:TetR/AcrR family transcriptional regulator [Gammaproteobacteria bacterium]
MRARTTVQPIENLSQRALQTRKKLKTATRDLLNQTGFHRLRVQDITRGAGVAAGLFYRYFPGVPEIVEEICEEFMDDLNARTRNLPVLTHPDDQIIERHALAVELYSAKPAIVRSLYLHADEVPSF